MLLAFDTATPQVSVALHDGSAVVATYLADEQMRHGELLAPGIAHVLDRVGATPRDLTAIAVGVGPGPFTGLRVGLVTARTMGYALDVPVRGVCTLDVLAAEAVDAGLTDFLVATDARRKEVYLAGYEGGLRTSGPDVVRPADAATGRTVVGRGGVLYPEVFPHRAGPEQPSAAVLCDVVARERYPLLDPEPLYLRRPGRRRRAPGQAGLVNAAAVRPATAADVAALVALQALALGADAWSEALVRDRVGATLVVGTDQELHGSVTVTVAGDVADLEQVAVRPDHRRAGLGRALLAAAVRRAAGAGADRLLLEVREDNAAARAFYAATGFAEIDRRRRYYRDGCDAVVLALALPGGAGATGDTMRP